LNGSEPREGFALIGGVLDRLFDEKLQQLIEDVRGEGWQGVQIDNDF
jgi:hypothetical protein